MDVELEWIGEGANALDGGAAPSPPSPFVGRRRELDALEQALGPGARIVVSAEGHRLGAGRSAVVWELARRAGGFGGGVLWWSIDRDGTHLQRVLHRWARQVGADRPAAPNWQAVREALSAGLARHVSAAGDLLVVIDGVQQGQIAAVHELISLLPESAAVVITADDAAAVEAFEGTHVVLAPMPVVDGLRLLRSEARSRLPQNAAVAAVEAVDGLPLGVRLIARRFQYAAPSDLAKLAELPEELAFESWTVDRLEGLATMARLFFVLYQDLDPRAQQVFRWVSALHGKAVDAARLAGLVLRHEEEVRQDLEEIGYRGLLEMADTDGVWHVHPQLRRWAATLMAEADEVHDAADRHLAHFRALADELVRAPARARAEILDLAPEILGAARRAQELGHRDAVIGLAEGLGGLGGPLVAGLFLSEAAELLSAAVELARAEDLSGVAGLEAALAALGGAEAAAGSSGEVALAFEADLELLRAEAMLALADISLEVEGALAQVQVWVEAAEADAAGRDQTAVREKVRVLEALGRRAEQRAEAVHRAADEVASASARGVRSILADVEQARDELGQWALDAEAHWTELQSLLAEVDSDAARVEAVVERARQESALAAEALEDVRERVKAFRAELPPNPKGPAAEMWSAVPLALSAAMDALRAVEVAAEQAGLGDLSWAREALERVRAHRSEVEAACEEALQAASEAVRISQMASEQKASLAEATDHARRAREASGRFAQLRDKVRGLLAAVSDTSEGAAMLRRLEELDAQVQSRVAVAASCADGVRKAGSEPERQRVLRQAKQAAGEVSSYAVEALALVPEAEELGEKLLVHVDERRIEEAHRAAREQVEELDGALHLTLGRLQQVRGGADRLADREVARLVAALEALESSLQGRVAAARDALLEVGRFRALAQAREALGAAERLAAMAREERLNLEVALGRAETALRERLSGRLQAARDQLRKLAEDVRASLEVTRQAEAGLRRLAKSDEAVFGAAAAAAKTALEQAERARNTVDGAAQRAAKAVDPAESARCVEEAERAAVDARQASVAASEAVDAGEAARRSFEERREQVAARGQRVRAALAATREHAAAVREAVEAVGDELSSTASGSAAAMVAGALATVEQIASDLDVLELVAGDDVMAADTAADVETSLAAMTDGLSGVEAELEVARELHEAAEAWSERREALRASVEVQLGSARAELREAREAWEQARIDLGGSMGGDARRHLGLAEHHVDETKASLKALEAAAEVAVAAESAPAAEDALVAVDECAQAVLVWAEQVRQAVAEARLAEETWLAQRRELLTQVSAHREEVAEVVRHWQATFDELIREVGPRPGARTEEAFGGVRQLLHELTGRSDQLRARADALAQTEVLEALLRGFGEVEAELLQAEIGAGLLPEALEEARREAAAEQETRRQVAIVRRDLFLRELEAQVNSLAERGLQGEAQLRAARSAVDPQAPVEALAPLLDGDAAIAALDALRERVEALTLAVHDTEDGQALLDAEVEALALEEAGAAAFERVGAAVVAHQAAVLAWQLERLASLADRVEAVGAEAVARGGLDGEGVERLRGRAALWSHLSFDLLVKEGETYLASAEALAVVGGGLAGWLRSRQGWPEDLDPDAAVRALGESWEELVDDNLACVSMVEEAHAERLADVRDEVEEALREAAGLRDGLRSTVGAVREQAAASVIGWHEPEVGAAAQALAAQVAVADRALEALDGLPALEGPAEHATLVEIGRSARARIDAGRSAAASVEAAWTDLRAALDVAHQERVDVAVATVLACRAEAMEARAVVASSRAAADHEVLGLENDGEVQDIRARLALIEQSAEALTEEVSALAAGLDAGADHADARRVALRAAGSVGLLLRRAHEAQAILDGLRSALTSAATDQLSVARRRVDEASTTALDAEAEAAEWLSLAREATVQWDNDPQARAALAEVSVRARAIFEIVEVCQAAAVRVARTASLRQAWEAASGAVAAVALLSEAQAALEASYGRLQEALTGAEVRYVETARDRVDAARQRAERAATSARELGEQAEALVEGWTLPDVRQAAGAVLDQGELAAEALARCEHVLTQALEASDRESTSAALESARELEAAGSEAEARAEQGLATLRRLLSARLEAQLEFFHDQATAAVADADEAMVRAVIARATGEEVATTSVDTTARATLVELVELAERAEVMAEGVRGLHARIPTCDDPRRGAELVEEVRTARDEVLAVAERAEAVRDRLDVELAERAKIDEHLARARGPFDARCAEVQIAFDELELTLEATRIEFEGGGVEPDIRDRWNALEGALAHVRASLPDLVHDGALSGDGLVDADVEATFGALTVRADALLDEARGALDALPVLVDDHTRNTRETREKLQARMAVRLAVGRARAPVRLVTRAARRALQAAVEVPEVRASWTATAALRDTVQARLDELMGLLDRVVHAEADEALGLADRARAITAEIDELSRRLLAASVLAQQEALELRSARATSLRAARSRLTNESVEALRAVGGAVAQLRTWRRQIAEWERPWREDEVRATVVDFRQADVVADGAIEAVRSAVAVVLGASDLARAGQAVERLRALVEVQVGAMEAAWAAREAVGAAIVAAHAARTAVRDAALERQRAEEEARGRIEAALGKGSASRRIPLFEKGLAVARLRGDDATLVGWLLDTAELYREVGRLKDARKLLDEALVRVGDERRRVRARLLEARSEVRMTAGEAEGAVTDAAEGIALARGAGDEDLEASLLGVLGRAARAHGDLEQAKGAHEAALRLLRPRGPSRVAAVHLASLARMASDAGAHHGAARLSHEAELLYRHVGDLAGCASELGRQAILATRRGQLSRALALAGQALDTARRVGDEAVLMVQLGTVGQIWLASGRPMRARTWLEQALSIADRRDDQLARGWLLSQLAAVARANARGVTVWTPGTAWAASKDAVRRARRGGVRCIPRDRGPSETEAREAVRLYLEAAAVAGRLGDRPSEGRRLLNAGAVLAGIGDRKAALAALQRAEAALTSTPGGERIVLDGLRASLG